MIHLPFEFAHPYLLLAALAALPALYWSRRAAGRVVFSSLRALPHGGETWRTRLAWLPDALHVLAAVIWLTVLAVLERRARPTWRSADGLEMCTIYWYFVCGLWAVLFPLVYVY